jgi:uncharacterized membrane protein YpjA
MFIWFPSQLNSTWSTAVMFVFAPDTALMFLASAAVLVLAMLARVVVYLHFARRAASGS